MAMPKGIRDISKEYIARYPELQFCEIPIPHSEFFYHSEARDKSMEFKIIKKITETKQHAELLVENIGDCLSLNRYPDILPYKDTLITPVNSTYMNSSLISGSSELFKEMFIATQGPTEHTTNNFWQLVWDYNVPLIIMGCNFIESDVEKCYQYFPIDDKVKTDDFEVFLVKSHKRFPNLIERVLMVSHLESEEYRIIKHYQCTNWPDLSVPCIADEFQSICYILDKIEVKWLKTKGKVVVHCSAGIGRTGVLIAIFNMVTEVKALGSLSVFRTVRILREQRWGMVSNEEQYQFIYNFMQAWISSYLASNL